MKPRLHFNSLLVPVDFSEAATRGVEQALLLVDGDAPVLILHHVIDPTLVDFACAHGWGTPDEVITGMRDRAQREMDAYRERVSADVEIEAVISEGVPFLEILQKAEDFAVDAIVFSKTTSHGPMEKLLFGSTVEKVLRGARRPVMVLPVD